MIYECPQGHVCFSKDSLDICGMKGCGKIPHGFPFSPYLVSFEV
jgi:hypothetical protein